MPKIIGLTGGIGSGKTTVAKMFSDLGVPVYIADLEAKKITNEKETLHLIQQQFGSEVVENGNLNRSALANLVFKNPEMLVQLNKIIHPLVAKDFENWVKNNENEKLLLKETAILFESGNYLKCDYVITVTAPIDVRIKRVQKRDQTSEDEIRRRMDNQWTDDERAKLSDFVIENNNLSDTLQQVKNIYSKIVINL